MTEWPSADQEAVYVPSALRAPTATVVEIKARIAAARVREGLPVGDETLSRILAQQPDPGRAGPGIFTEAERQDIYADRDRVARAQAVLADAEDVFGGLMVCWRDGRRGVRILLTGAHERYRRLLSEVIDPDRLVIATAAFTESELRRLGEQVRAQSDELAELGIFLTMHGLRLHEFELGFEIEYLAADFERAERVLRDRFGEFSTIRHRGASNHTFKQFPFGSWLADGNRLHVFYGLPHNGERPGGGQAFETESAVIVSLTILDWRGNKTLIGGYIPSHATVNLREPLDDRLVIDDSENRSRPHWTQASSHGPHEAIGEPVPINKRDA